MSVTRPCSLELVDELLQIGTRLGGKDRIGVDELEPAKKAETSRFDLASARHWLGSCPQTATPA